MMPYDRPQRIDPDITAPASAYGVRPSDIYARMVENNPSAIFYRRLEDMRTWPLHSLDMAVSMYNETGLVGNEDDDYVKTLGLDAFAILEGNEPSEAWTAALTEADNGTIGELIGRRVGADVAMRNAARALVERATGETPDAHRDDVVERSSAALAAILDLDVAEVARRLSDL